MEVVNLGSGGLFFFFWYVCDVFLLLISWLVLVCAANIPFQSGETCLLY